MILFDINNIISPISGKNINNNSSFPIINYRQNRPIAHITGPFIAGVSDAFGLHNINYRQTNKFSDLDVKREFSGPAHVNCNYTPVPFINYRLFATRITTTNFLVQDECSTRIKACLHFFI
jgi:hypothetical protein